MVEMSQVLHQRTQGLLLLSMRARLVDIQSMFLGLKMCALARLPMKVWFGRSAWRNKVVPQNIDIYSATEQEPFLRILPQS